MYNKKLLLTVLKDLNKAKKPTKKKDINYDATGKGMLNKNYAGKPVRLATDTLYNPTPYRINAKSDNGIEQTLEPYDETTVNFPGANYIDEYPEMKKGGGFSRNLLATNRLFKKNTLFKKNPLTKPNKLFKKKSYKRKTYDPMSMYFQDGGENKTKLNKTEEKEFQKFYKTLPENLQTDDSTYDIRGYWDALGRPQEFDYTQPTEADGYYHGFSINPNTGEYLKSPAHPTFQHAVDEDRKIGYRPVTNVYGRNIATENESIADPEQQTFLRNTEGPVSYKKGGEPPYNNLPPTYLTALQNFVYPNVKDDPERTGYNSVNNTINYDSQSPIENMDNKWWMEHELFHDLQNQAGGMSTSGVVGQRPNPYAASDESMQGYYDRRDSDVERTIDSMIAQDPNLQFIPRNKLAEGAGPGFIGAENLQYADPTTLEGEARQYEQYIREGNPSIFPNRKKGGLANYIETELTPEEIEEYKKGGYIVEDISIPSLNKFAQGGEEDCPKGYMRSYDGKCVPSVAPEQVDADEWYRNWYANRVIQDEEGQKLLDNARSKILKRAEKFPETTWYSDPDSSTYGSFEPLTGELRLNSDALDGNPFLKDEVKFHEKGHYLTSPNMLDPETDTVEEVVAHPIQHLRNYETNIVDQALKSRKDIPKEDRDHYDYMKGVGEAQPYTEEISKNLMQLRRLAGFKPDQVITEEDINNLYKKADEKGWTDPNSDFFVEPFLNLINYTKDTEQLKTLFNKLAKNEPEQVDDFQPQQVQYGGALSKFIGGGSPCDDGYTYDPKLGCIPLSEENMTEDQKWMVDWYKNRKIQFPEDQPSFKKVVEKVLPAYNPESPMLEQMQSFPVYETMPKEYMQEDIGGFPAAGMYDPSGKVPKIYFNPELTPEQKSDTERHELTNYLMEPVKDKLYPMYNKIVEENIIPFDENWPKEKQDFYDYVIDPEEQNIQSYLNVARKKFNLKADEVITPERLNQMRDEAEKKGMLDKDNKNFNQDIYLLFKMAKDDEGLMKWFNLIAKKDSNKDDIQYGKYGGSLHKFIEGGDRPCPPGQKYNTKTGKCEYILADHAPLNMLRDEKREQIERLDKFGNLTPILDEILPGSSYNPKYIQNLKEFAMTETPQWKKDRDKFGKDKIAFYESLFNPKKWGLNDYSDYSSYNSAFRNARESGEKEFVYKGKRYNTNLVPKEQSDLYWESKDFLKEYYEDQDYKDFYGPSYYDKSEINDKYIKGKYGYTWPELDAKQRKLKEKLGEKAYENAEYKKLDVLMNNIRDEQASIRALANEEFNTWYNNIVSEDRKSRIQKLDKPTYFSITTQRPKHLKEEGILGYWREKENEIFLNAESDRLNTNYIHELSHKGDAIEDAFNNMPTIDIELANTNPRIKNWTQEFFDYVSNPTEVESRKLSTLFYLHKNKKPWKAGKITLDALYELYDNIQDLPSDIQQLLQLYGEQKIDLLNYLNSNYRYEKKKDGGAVNYQLGDEIDEATMNELKRLGYTFEEL